MAAPKLKLFWAMCTQTTEYDTFQNERQSFYKSQLYQFSQKVINCDEEYPLHEYEYLSDSMLKAGVVSSPFKFSEVSDEYPRFSDYFRVWGELSPYVINEMYYEASEGIEDKPHFIHVQGPWGETKMFNPNVLEHYKDEIIAMLNKLHDNFFESKGGGWSILNFCMRKDGTLWTEYKQECIGLFYLGMAIGKIKYTLPRDQWCSLPSGEPYVTILDDDALAIGQPELPSFRELKR